MPYECAIKKCPIAPGKFNYGVILKRYSTATKSGMEQRDYAVLYGANGATTIQYKDDQFVFPKENKIIEIEAPAFIGPIKKQVEAFYPRHVD